MIHMRGLGHLAHEERPDEAAAIVRAAAADGAAADGAREAVT